MKMKGRKVIVFFLNHFTFFGLYLLQLIKSPDTMVVTGTLLLNMMLFNSVVFVGGVLTKDFIKSKWYVKELDRG